MIEAEQCTAIRITAETLGNFRDVESTEDSVFRYVAENEVLAMSYV